MGRNEIPARLRALAAGHDLPTVRFAAVRRRTDGAGGFFLISIRCSFWRSPSSRKLPIIFVGTWPARFAGLRNKRRTSRRRDGCWRLRSAGSSLAGRGGKKIGGMDRQTLRHWVIRFNDQGANGLINFPSPGVLPELNATHRAFLARIVEEGPIPAIHGVVRWRACDLIMRLHEEFGISVSDDTIYRALKDLGFSHLSARPKAYKHDPEAVEAFKKTSLYAWRKSARSPRQALR
jgi:transposase